MDNDKRDLNGAILAYMSALRLHEVRKEALDKAAAELTQAGRELESVYFGRYGVTASEGRIIVKNGAKVYMLELGRSGRVYPKMVEIETYVEI